MNWVDVWHVVNGCLVGWAWHADGSNDVHTVFSLVSSRNTSNPSWCTPNTLSTHPLLLILCCTTSLRAALPKVMVSRQINTFWTVFQDQQIFHRKKDASKPKHGSRAALCHPCRGHNGDLEDAPSKNARLCSSGAAGGDGWDDLEFTVCDHNTQQIVCEHLDTSVEECEIDSLRRLRVQLRWCFQLHQLSWLWHRRPGTFPRSLVWSVKTAQDVWDHDATLKMRVGAVSAMMKQQSYRMMEQDHWAWLRRSWKYCRWCCRKQTLQWEGIVMDGVVGKESAVESIVMYTVVETESAADCVVRDRVVGADSAVESIVMDGVVGKKQSAVESIVVDVRIWERAQGRLDCSCGGRMWAGLGTRGGNGDGQVSGGLCEVARAEWRRCLSLVGCVNHSSWCCWVWYGAGLGVGSRLDRRT